MNYKAMCVQQGYVPSTCLLDGQLVWIMINEGKDPCSGCNHNRCKCNGRHAPYEDKNYGLMCLLDKWGEAERKETEERKRRYDELVRQRKKGHIEGYTRTLLEVRWDMGRDGYEIDIIVKDIVDEKAHYISCKCIDEALQIVRLCCDKYDVEQIHVEDIGIGTGIYDGILKLGLNNVDVVPLKYVKIRL